MHRHGNEIISSQWNEQGKVLNYCLEIPASESVTTGEPFAGMQAVFGQFATVRPVDGGFEGIRDPLGIGKLFYTVDKDGKLQFSGRFSELLGKGGPVFALPRGKKVFIGEDGSRKLLADIAPVAEARGFSQQQEDTGSAYFTSPEGEQFRTALRHRMEQAFALIRQLEDRGYTIYVALSGGLDSSIVATMASRFLQAPVACTLDLGRSEDAAQSAQIAAHIGIRHEVFPTSREEILAAVEEAPVLCQDYRDFNVHCAALNMLLGKNIRELADREQVAEDRRIILTGDLMNEYTSDYHEENVDGTVYYRLPRVGQKILQNQLIAGLDTSDREVFPFLHYGLKCIQPYAITYDLYASVPGSVLKLDNNKRELNGHLVDPEVMALLPKSKLRAQVGSKENMGVLGLCHREGIGEQQFLDALLGQTGSDKKSVPILMGRYSVEAFEAL